MSRSKYRGKEARAFDRGVTSADRLEHYSNPYTRGSKRYDAYEAGYRYKSGGALQAAPKGERVRPVKRAPQSDYEGQGRLFGSAYTPLPSSCYNRPERG